MRIGALPIPCAPRLLAAHLAQTVCQAGGHRSTPTDVAVEPVTRIEQHLKVRPSSGHTFDIRV